MKTLLVSLFKPFVRKISSPIQQRVKTKPIGLESAKERFVFVANAMLPTLQLSFLVPMRKKFAAGEYQSCVLTENEIKVFLSNPESPRSFDTWLNKQMLRYRPTVFVFCRYSGPGVDTLLDYAASHGIPTILHIDDDLLNVPLKIGKQKYEFHNDPSRLSTLKTLLKRVDLIYCSTQALAAHFQAQNLTQSMIDFGDIFASGSPIKGPEEGPVSNSSKKLGYMGFDHAQDFEVASGAIARILSEQPEVILEIFGPIAIPKQLAQFESQIVRLASVKSYESFIEKLASREWVVGICPLQKTPFNYLKADTKWVEYTRAGIATVATKGMMYDHCCANDCGLLVTTEDEWYQAISHLLGDPHERAKVISNAQARLQEEYSDEILLKQIEDKVAKARGNLNSKFVAVQT